MGQGVGQRERSSRLEVAIEAVGSRTHVFPDRAEQEDEQRLREAICEQRGIRICCDESPHGEAADPRLRTFHTVSEGKFCEVELLLYGVI